MSVTPGEADAALFDIVGGGLVFKTAPDYEPTCTVIRFSYRPSMT
jgi:hypothetical protein